MRGVVLGAGSSMLAAAMVAGGLGPDHGRRQRVPVPARIHAHNNAQTREIARRLRQERVKHMTQRVRALRAGHPHGLMSRRGRIVGAVVPVADLLAPFGQDVPA